EVAAAKVMQGVDSLGVDTAVGQIVENVVDTSTPLDDPRVTDLALAIEHLPKEGDGEDVKPKFEFEFGDEDTQSNDEEKENDKEEK
ncbi:hypothetical protein BGZ93_001740, partial [Podila epicladia]